MGGKDSAKLSRMKGGTGGSTYIPSRIRNLSKNTKVIKRGFVG